MIADGATGLPLGGATVKCEQFSYVSPYLCNGVTTTNSQGIYSFTPVFFHDTDKITLTVEAPGYTPLHFEQTPFTQPELHADLGLFPITGTLTSTPTPVLMCTAPACQSGVLTCGDPNGCPGGCGTICQPWTLTPTPFLMCTAPACEGGVLTCGDPNGCPGGCGTICLRPTATP